MRVLNQASGIYHSRSSHRWKWVLLAALELVKVLSSKLCSVFANSSLDLFVSMARTSKVLGYIFFDKMWLTSLNNLSFFKDLLEKTSIPSKISQTMRSGRFWRKSTFSSMLKKWRISSSHKFQRATISSPSDKSNSCASLELSSVKRRF